MKISRDSLCLSLMNDDHFLAFGGIYENIRIFKGSMYFFALQLSLYISINVFQ